MSETLSLGFSPCPNDTFIFDAMAHGKVEPEGLDFKVTMADVAELNKMAFAKTLDITKISFHAFAHLTQHYALLNSGSALGMNCGPLLISKNARSFEEVDDLKIAIPGKYTTANLLLSIAAPNACKKIEVLFSQIEDRILTGEFDAGLIIHENRFTYEGRGLKKIVDLGEYWHARTRMPIPLGGIVVRRTLAEEVKGKIDRVLRRSVEYALARPESGMEFVKAHAREMEDAVIRKHIGLYVNEHTQDLGERGRGAIQTLFRLARKKGIVPGMADNIFLESAPPVA